MDANDSSQTLADQSEKVQLLLSEKRTVLSLMRTGIAFAALPLSVVSILIATSHFYDSSKVLYLFVPVLSVSILLLILGGWVVLHALRKYRALDKIIKKVKAGHPELKDLIT